eukprot:TCALIF_00809-PA protein Name:"Similar to MTMR3 Myotubularin-related protein 3 (Homo sapiens)" AED:0.09 eAED:0.11 QI:0/0/0/1/1/1/3/0/1109
MSSLSSVDSTVLVSHPPGPASSSSHTLNGVASLASLAAASSTGSMSSSSGSLSSGAILNGSYDVSTHVTEALGSLGPLPARDDDPQPSQPQRSGLFGSRPGPFRLLAGENVRHEARLTEGGFICLTDYRLCATVGAAESAFVSMPLGLVDYVELRELFYLHVFGKDARYVCLTFENNAMAESWIQLLQECLNAPADSQTLFAFVHQRALSAYGPDTPPVSPPIPDDWFSSEIARLRFDQQVAWRVTKANEDFKLCSTYPERLLIPHSVSDADLSQVAEFRLARRVPSVVWRHVGTGAVLARSSQPKVGWLGWRSKEDEQLIRCIAEACAYDRGTSSNESSVIETSSLNNGDANDSEDSAIKDLSSEAQKFGQASKVLIVDARSYAAALGNRARGGGLECEEYYTNSEVVFMNLPNIHTIRKSFQALRSLCSSSVDQTSWFQALDATRWLSQISSLFRGAVRCASALENEARPVLVHCSDGWDRTPQLTSLTQLLLDPYYRSFEGFQVLVEKEWLHYGHKMADRCGNPFADSDPNERCPIFLQWLDCVHQLLLQYPCHFEFNTSFLVKLARHTYSQLFGTFLCNSLMERKKYEVQAQTRSVWTFLRQNPRKFRNLLFSKRDEILWPKAEVRDLLLWKEVYVSELRNVSDHSSKSSVISSDSSDSYSPLGGPAPRDDSEERRKEDRPHKPSLKIPVMPNVDNATLASGSANAPLLTENDSLPTASQDNSLEAFTTGSVGMKGDQDDSKDRAHGSFHKCHKNGFESSTDTLVPEEDHRRSNQLTNATSNPQQISTLGQSTITESEEHEVKFKRPRSSQNEGRRESESTAGLEELMAQASICAPCEFLSRSMEDLIDTDGLPTHKDMVQQRLNEIFYQHRKEVQDLRRDLMMSKQALLLQKNAARKLSELNASESLLLDTPLNGYDRMSSNEDGNGEIRTSSTTSEVSSWEAVDENEAKPVLWVPDHASEFCMRQVTKFWTGLRKHHCRNCGLLFCHNCSDNQAPLPEEHLYRPVRVCDDCIAVIDQDRTQRDQEEEGKEKTPTEVKAVNGSGSAFYDCDTVNTSANQQHQDQSKDNSTNGLCNADSDEHAHLTVETAREAEHELKEFKNGTV